MKRRRPLLWALLCVFMLPWLMGDDCEIDIDGWGHYFDPYYYDPGPIVIVDDPYCCYDPYYY